MRTLKRREQTVRILSPTVTTGALGSKTASWTGTPASIQADVQPLSSSAQRAEYGERADRIMTVILPNGSYDIGDGVWLAGESTADPPWLVIGKAAWRDLTNLTIERRA